MGTFSFTHISYNTCCWVQICWHIFIEGVKEGAAHRLYAVARRIMCWDAVRRQTQIKFGGGPGGATTELEADEHVFFHWKEEVAVESTEGVDTSMLKHWRHFWYVWIGVIQRGAPEKFWLQSMGITSSLDTGGGAPPPPLDDATWSGVCEELFAAESRIIPHTDGALAYRTWWVIHVMGLFFRRPSLAIEQHMHQYIQGLGTRTKTRTVYMSIPELQHCTLTDRLHRLHIHLYIE